ncbi:hypothetical protein JC606_16595 [Vibrio sp. IB15]|uniref:hypothetical protein n=1 Tax=Vibrio sp. IB15 TaxID=2779368 RepID=UPI0018E85B86|nr:hypothetical protein [Vibrio sp. IB15]MBJ2147981.1 hypothetical protein [Vibrio sp. IB15]
MKKILYPILMLLLFGCSTPNRDAVFAKYPDCKNTNPSLRSLDVYAEDKLDWIEDSCVRREEEKIKQEIKEENEAKKRVLEKQAYDKEQERIRNYWASEAGKKRKKQQNSICRNESLKLVNRLNNAKYLGLIEVSNDGGYFNCESRIEFSGMPHAVIILHDSITGTSRAYGPFNSGRAFYF